MYLLPSATKSHTKLIYDYLQVTVRFNKIFSKRRRDEFETPCLT